MLLFRVGETVYGCDVASAQAIVPLRPCTRLPGAPPFVRGLVNVRGSIATIVDLRLRLAPDAATSGAGSVLLVRHGQRLVGVVVDEIVDVRRLVVEDTEATDASGSLVRGVARDEDTEAAAVVVLDIDALIRQVLLS